jgi:glycosyltransferase involved in cell wall biosynthesis
MLISEGGGEVIAQGDAAGLRDLIAGWADDRAAAAAIGAKAREVFERAYSRTISLARYAQVLHEAAR